MCKSRPCSRYLICYLILCLFGSKYFVKIIIWTYVITEVIDVTEVIELWMTIEWFSLPRCCGDKTICTLWLTKQTLVSDLQNFDDNGFSNVRLYVGGVFDDIDDLSCLTRNLLIREFSGFSPRSEQSHYRCTYSNIISQTYRAVSIDPGLPSFP